MQIEQQLITLAGVPVTRAFVQCRDASRDRSGYKLTARAWTASGPDVSPASATADAPMFFFSSLVGASISLNVTSASGEAATVTKAPKALDTQVHTRVVSVASGAGGWQVLATTSGWRSFTGAGADCTAVPPINETGPLWAGFANGAIYTSADALASTPTLSTTLAGGISCMWANEGDQNHILAGHGSSLSRTTNGGASWAPVGTFAASVTDCQSSPSNPAEIRVCAGDTEQISYDGGASWLTLVTVVSGATAAMMASAPWGHAVAADGIAHEADSVVFEEGYAVDWTAIANPADRPSGGLASITPLLSAQGYLAGECADLVRDGALDSLILSAGAGRLYQLLWNGSWFVASLLPASAAAGPGKVINALAAYPIGTAGAVQIGYGALGAPPVAPGNLIIPTWGVTGANDGIWIHDATGWRKAAAPVAAQQWRGMAINPFNPLDRLLINNYASVAYTPGMTLAMGGHSPVWHTADGGATWSEVALVAPSYTITEPYIAILSVAWSQAGGWVVAGAITSYAHRAVPLVWRPGGAWGVNDTTHEGFVGQIAAGIDGEILFVHEWGDWISSVSTAGVWTAPTSHGDNNGDNMLTTSVVPGTRTAYAVRSNGLIHRSDNYRSAAWVQIGTATVSTASLVAMPDGSVYGSRIAGSTCEIVLIQPGGAAAVVATLPTPYLATLASNASRSAVGGMAQSYGFAYWDGTTWSKIDFPTGMGAGNFGRLTVTDEAS
jgi:hypothetical protein